MVEWQLDGSGMVCVGSIQKMGVGFYGFVYTILWTLKKRLC